MANDPLPVSPSAPPPSIDPAEMKIREDRFTASADPWNEVVLLEYGGDRTFAWTISRMVLQAEPAQRPALEQRLLLVLARPELTDAGRQFICRMLGAIGSAVCVPAVAPLLRDERTADDARLALDTISDPTVDAAYRGALDSLHGRAKAGLIGSIAARGDRSSVDALTAVATNAREPVEVRAVAERAVKQLLARN